MSKLELHQDIVRYYYCSKKVHVLYFFVRLKSLGNGRVHMKQSEMADLLGVTTRTIRYNLRHCINEGLVDYDSTTHKIYLASNDRVLDKIGFTGYRNKNQYIVIEDKYLGTKSDFDLFCFSILNSIECEKRKKWLNKRDKNVPTDESNEGYRAEWVHLSCATAAKYAKRSLMTASRKKRLAKVKGLLNLKPCFRLIKGLSPLLAAFYTDSRGERKRLLVKGDKVYERLADIYISGIYGTQKLLYKK